MNTMVILYELTPLGDRAIMVKLGDTIDERTHQLVSLLSKCLEEAPFAGMVEYVPSFNSVTVYYDPFVLLMAELGQLEANANREATAGSVAVDLNQSPYDLACRKIEGIIKQLEVSRVVKPDLVEIPVCYGGEYGVDLEFVAEHNQLTVDEVIQIHCGRDYLVYMIGFAPGFPYLGGMDKRISAPRKQSPRLSIVPGTVGIAGEQTGIYPIDTPGGWQLIGRTPLALFLPEENPPSLLKAGNYIRFYPISHTEYERWSRS